MIGVIICPLCGYSFRLDPSLRKRIIKCPMCAHQFSDPEMNLYKIDVD